jgi:hypothetical protein
MRNLINSAAATAMCAIVTASLAPSQAAAGVVSLGQQATIRSASPVEQVYYRRYYRGYYHHPYYAHRHYYRRHYGYAPYYYNPVGAAVGTAAAVATIPFWGWGYPY